MTKGIVVNYHITDTSITLTYLGKIRTVDRSTEIGTQVLEKIKAGLVSEVPGIIDVDIKIKQDKTNTNKAFEVIDGLVHCNGVELPSVLSNKIIKFMEEGLPFDILLKFWDNLNKNPSEKAKKELFGFLEANHFPLTPDGYFIAYKKVRSDFKDIHTKSMNNSPGKTVTMERSKVCDDSSKTCASGLHIASYNYANNIYGNRASKQEVLIEVKVNPADVVSIPSDYKSAKCRTCAYQVIGPITDEHKVEVAPKEVPVTKAAKKAAKAKSGVLSTVDVLQVGNYSYKGTIVTKEDLIKAVDKSSDFIKIKPSDLAKAFKNINAVTVYRYKKATNNYVYLVEFANECVKYVQQKTK